MHGQVQYKGIVYSTIMCYNMHNVMYHALQCMMCAWIDYLFQLPQ